MNKGLAIAAVLVLVLASLPASAQIRDVASKVSFDQRLDQLIPTDATFTDSTGHPVRLKDVMGQRPLILAMSYYECPNLCMLMFDSLVSTLKKMSLRVGQDFDVLAVSIDPREGPTIAARKRREYMRKYGRTAPQGWHFLTGSKKSIHRLASAVGFRYVYDPELDQYDHATGLVILTPQGQISRYIYGLKYPRTDLRLALVEASKGKIGSPVDQLILLCCQYDPKTGKYSLVISNLLRLGGAITVVLLGGLILVHNRKQKGR